MIHMRQQKKRIQQNQFSNEKEENSNKTNKHFYCIEYNVWIFIYFQPKTKNRTADYDWLSPVYEKNDPQKLSKSAITKRQTKDDEVKEKRMLKQKTKNICLKMFHSLIAFLLNENFCTLRKNITWKKKTKQQTFYLCLRSAIPLHLNGEKKCKRRTVFSLYYCRSR